MGFDDVDAYAPAGGLSPKVRRQILLGLLALIIVFIALAVSSQAIWFWLNLLEFSELFIRPIYFEIIGGLILSIIALFRVDFKNRRSLTWWLIRLVVRLIRERGIIEAVPPNYLDFKLFRMTPTNFALWQVTKALIGITIFRDVIFGMSIVGTTQGWDSGLSGIWSIFALPFVTPPLDMSYAGEHVIPLIPALTLIVSPILGALGVRLVLLVGLTQLIRVFTPTVSELSGERAQLWWRAAIVEGLIAIGLFWATVNTFFTSFIDYNTKYAIGGLLASGVLFAFFAYLDGYKRRGLVLLTRRGVFQRFLAVFIIILVVGSIMAVNNSIADARKVDWLGPYTVQQVAVNRYLAELDQIIEIPYNFSINSVPPNQIDDYINQYAFLLDKVMLWDREAAFVKLRPEIGLIPFVDFQDSDILRFNKTLIWSASMKPVLPAAVRPEDRWFAQHLVYTHVPNGFLLLEAHEGTIVPTERFFDQRRIYYGEGGLFSEVWAAFPTNRETTNEVGGYFYSGIGGIDVPPPLSWLFEFNFFLAFRDQTIHVIRYRDVYERMELLFPYFQYEFGREKVDIFPVTDGKNSYYLMPLIVELPTQKVPWSVGNPIRRLVGYALIDTYNGTIQLISLGDDFFSQLFTRTYSDYVITAVPDWLKEQTRYPEELFTWRVGMYNFYHVKDPAIFITGREFFEVPPDLDPFFIVAQPPGFQSPEFIGLLSLELRGAEGRNLAGYMVVRNDYPYLGEMRFYAVPLDSEIKLLGPSAVLQALERNPEFAQLRTLLRSPRLGDTILYRIGDYDVYFIPVYTAGQGGVVSEIGAVAVVGAAFTGEYYIGLAGGQGGQARGVTEAFREFLMELSGLVGQAPRYEEAVGLRMEDRKENIERLLAELNMTVAEPFSISPDVAFALENLTYVTQSEWDAARSAISRFVEEWGGRSDKILMWMEDGKLNLGVLVENRGIVELHFITITIRVDG